jgi:hypothetical protein
MAGESHQIDFDRKGSGAGLWEKTNFIFRRIFTRLSELESQIGTAAASSGSGTSDHALLTHLAYATSGHTGFAPTAHVHAEADVTNLVADLAGKEDVLGFTPENIANKGAISGYAPLDAAQKVPALNLGGSSGADASHVLAGDQTWKTIGSVNPSNAETIKFFFDDHSGTPGTVLWGAYVIPWDCYIEDWTLLSDVSGSISVDIRKVEYAGYPDVAANSICDANYPLLSSATKNSDSTLAGWSRNISAGDIIIARVLTVATLSKAYLSLDVSKIEVDPTEERIPIDLVFSPASIAAYFDPQPINLIDGTEAFDADTGQFTEYTEGNPGTFTVTGGVGQIIHTGGGAKGNIVTETAGTLTMPNAFVSIEVPVVTKKSTGYDNGGIGLVKDQNNFIFASIDRVANSARIQIKIGGSNTFLAIVLSQTWFATAPFKFALSLMGNSACLYKDVAGVWTYVTGFDVTAYYDFKTVGNLTGWKAGFTYASGADGDWSFDNLKWGRFGGVGMRDQSMVVNEDGSVYVDGDYVYFGATIVDPKAAGYYGVFKLKMTDYTYQQVGAIMIERGAKIYGDLSGNIIWYANGDRRFVIGTWGNGFGGDLQVLYKLETSLDLLTGTNVIQNMTQLNLPGELDATYGAYDAFLVYDTINSRWLIAYCLVHPTSFVGNHFYGAAAYSSDLINWNLIAADTANEGYEGIKIIFANGGYWILIGGPVGSGNNSIVYNGSLVDQGRLNAIFSGGTDTQPHPCMWKHGNYVYLLSFNNTRYGGVTFTWGQPTLQRSPRYY